MRGSGKVGERRSAQCSSARRQAARSAGQGPVSGAYVEIRRGRNVIIGRAVWTKGRLFGVRTQDRVDLVAMKQGPGRAGGRRDASASGERIERCGQDRIARDAAMARTLERNRALSHIMQFALIAFGTIAACAVVATAVYDVLQAPLARIQQAMGSNVDMLD